MTGDSVRLDGQAVKKHRRFRGWTQQDLAHRIRDRTGSFAKRTLENIEAGKLVSLRSAKVVAEELGIDVADLQLEQDATSHNLPSRLSSFIGRENERLEIRDLLHGARLVTLTGAGGCGKSRLALEVAGDLVRSFRDGVWLVELAPLANSALVPQAVAATLGIREEPEQPLTELLIRYLKRRETLLLLDNCEHLVSACAELAGTLLPVCPDLRILATSREGMGITGEAICLVPPLRLPDVEYHSGLVELQSVESVRLFVERARSVRSDFTLSESNAPALVDICHRLDGIPLALEMAAARVRTIPVREIAKRLDQRFLLLSDGHRSVLPQHRTLGALLDWSYDQLSVPEQSLLRCLSVFSGGWTLNAAESVCAVGGAEKREVVESLSQLVSKSLVEMDAEGGQDATADRYRLLETVRQYARERLLEEGDDCAARERHRDYFLALAEEAAPELAGAEQLAWMSRLDDEHDNLRGALEACKAGNQADREVGLRLVGALGRFWLVRGYWNEGRARCVELLADTDASARSSIRAKALRAVGILSLVLGDTAEARSLYQESLVISREIGDKAGIASSLNNLGNIASSLGDYAEARSLYVESLRLGREVGDKSEIANTLINLGVLARKQCDWVAARSVYEESLGLNRELGDKRGIAMALANLGNVTYAQGDSAGARPLFEESLALFRELGDMNGIANTLNNLGNMAWRRADCAAARELYEESLVITRALGDKHGISLALQNLGNVALKQGELPEARVLYEEGLTLWRELQEKEGIAITLSNLGSVASLQGSYAEARSLLGESLALAHELGNKRGIAAALGYLGILAFRQGHLGRAARLLAACEAMAQEIGWILNQDDRRESKEQIALVRDQLGDRKFRVAWAAGQAMALDQAIEFALSE